MRAMVFAVMVGCGLTALPAADVPVSAMVANARPTSTQVEFYQEGNRLYQEGDFEAALASYLRLVEAGFESGEVYYNIGNTYFQARRAGPIHPVLRARPADYSRGIRTFRPTLDLARSLTVDEIEPLPRSLALQRGGVVGRPPAENAPGRGGRRLLPGRDGLRPPAHLEEGSAGGCVGPADRSRLGCRVPVIRTQPGCSRVRTGTGPGGRRPPTPGRRDERTSGRRDPHGLHCARRDHGSDRSPLRGVGGGRSGGWQGRVGPGGGAGDDLVLCSQSFFRFADLGDDGLCRGGPDKGCGVIVSAIDVVVDRLD